MLNHAIKELMTQQELAEQRWRETLPALESIQAGRTIPAERVFEWMRSWGTDNQLPKPTPEKR